MNRGEILPTLLTLALGAGGAGLAALAGLPAAALVGSTAAVAAGALARAPVVLPGWLRDAGFAAIGCALGAGITPEAVGQMASWPASLAILALALVAMIVAAAAILRQLFRLDPATALLASSPGALSYTVALVAEGRGDARAVVVLQSLRLFAITLGLPLILGATVGQGAAPWASLPSFGWGAAAALLVAALALGTVAAARGLPAGHLVVGMALSGSLHAAGLLEGPPPPAFAAAGLVVTGAVIGTRFAGTAWRDLGRFSLAAACVVSAATGIAAVAALVANLLLGIPFGQAWVTYAPGGAEAMAAMALALGYDPAFVAVHHLLRILALIATLPLLLRWAAPAR